jgi:CHAT domain-containing protein
MRSKLFSFTFAITLGLVAPIVSAIVFPEVVVAQTVEEKKKEADRLLQQGIQQFQVSQFTAALESWQQALLLYRKIKNRHGEGNVLGNLGNLYSSLGNYAKAIEYQEQSLVIDRDFKDRLGEGQSLGNLGIIYYLTGNYPKAIEYQKQSLVIDREFKDRLGEGRSLGNLGVAYSALGNYLKAIEYQEQSLAITREIKDRQGEGNALGNLGIAYSSLGNYSKAIEYQEQHLAIAREINDQRGEGAALGNLGNAYNSLGNYPKAIEYHEQSLTINRETKDKQGEGAALGNLGNTYDALGNYPKAIEYHQQRLAIVRAIKDRRGEGESLGNLGNAYNSLGNYPKAIEHHEQYLVIAREIKDRYGEGAALGNMGNAYNSLGNYPKAIEHHQQYLVITREIKNRQGEGTALGNLGLTYNALGNYSKAIEYHEQRLEIAREIKDREGEYIALNNLGVALASKEPELAIIFYKQSVTVIEILRQGNRSLPKELQFSYTQSVVKAYRNLADLLLKQNRTIEALQVLDLLKAQDLQDFLKSNQRADRPTQRIEFFPQEQAILTAFNNRSSDLNTFLKSPTVQTQTQYLEANAANQNLQLKTYTDLQSRLKKLGKNAALFYPLILDDRLELVILTNDRPPIHKPIAISRKQLETEVQSFRNQLQNRSRLIKEPAQKLYQSFIQPIEAELKAAGVDTIVYAPDDIMRYFPLAALHDGKQWLAERYQINYLTALALTPLEPDQNKTPRVLAAALTEAHQVKVLDKTYTFPALQFTQPEIESLAKTLPNTTTIINQGFNRQTLTTGIPQNTILHLATHGMFVPNSPDQSIIVMGDGSTISLREIEQQWKLPNVSLVVLSACETAIGGKLGNGIEVLGFGYQMQRIGSRASISSLWTIDDGGTQGFMNTFYTELKQGKTPAFAIQKTQKDFIQGKVTAKDIERSRGAVPYVRGGIPTDLTHPYYWAPFILVGNGL